MAPLQLLVEKVTEVEKGTASWKGKTPGSVAEGDAFLSNAADPERTPLAVLEAEINRLGKLVAADRETAAKLSAVSKRIDEATVALARLQERLDDCEGAAERARALVAEREDGYIRVFEAILGEERVLNELYAPLMERLKGAGGTLAKISFTVARVADVAIWASQGEKDLFDLRGGPFRGMGSLAARANEMLAPAWQTGDAAAVSAAMVGFRTKFEDALLEKAPYPRSDRIISRA